MENGNEVAPTRDLKMCNFENINTNITTIQSKNKNAIAKEITGKMIPIFF
jgi:hypothetical protein